MKIALLVPEMEMGGVEECVADLAAGLTARGQSVSLLSAGGRLIPSLKAAGVECSSLPLHRKDPFTFLYSLTGAERILRRIRPDIIHAHSRVPAWAGHYAARRLPSAHLVTTFHAFYNTHFPSRIMGRGERVIAVSGALADYARRHFGVPEKNLRVVYNGVRPVAGGQTFTPVTLGTLGRLTSGKGFELFLEILRKVRVVHPETRGVVGLGVECPADPAVRRLEDLAAGGGVSGAVEFLFNPRREDFFAAANIYVGCVTEPEGFGRVIIEAQTAGLPVAASRLGAFPELIEDGETGLLAAPEAGAFAEALMRLIEDPSLRERLSRAGRARAGERFTVDRMVDETVKVYEELLG